ncbi:MAG TPA: beta family protein [Vicinamibacterales bacterium]|nr:beta family protein [Vicinamibacterales bacterium]
MTRYMPILKAREGEFGALEALPEDIRNTLTPLIEIPKVPHDYVRDRPTKTLEQHIAGIGDRLRKSWGDRPVYVQLPRHTDGASETLSDGLAAVGGVLQDCAGLGVRAIPVLVTSNSTPYLTAVRDYSANSDEGVCLRLHVGDFDQGDPDSPSPKSRIDALLERVGATHHDSVDVVLDLGDLSQDLNMASMVARTMFGELPYRTAWRSVALAAASFPENLSEVVGGTERVIKRHEWALWNRLRRRDEWSQVVFGDYAIAHSKITELDPRTMRMSASIRYTTDASWLVLKGRNVREHGFDQYFDLCRRLIDRSEYKGPGFSWGDEFIFKCAQGLGGPGNATTWRKVGTNHHLTLVARAIAAAAVV